jgi:YidC/Oxa1 family membrane protein insertase
MKAQLRNMAVQPLLKEIQTKYKDQPEKMQKELMKLYKEHGFNPLAGCWPMLLPWPVLIALFFVFQNTIELRGVPFAWLPDLSPRGIRSSSSRFCWGSPCSSSSGSRSGPWTRSIRR